MRFLRRFKFLSICCGKEAVELEDGQSISSHPDGRLCRGLSVGDQEEYDHKYKLPVRVGWVGGGIRTTPEVVSDLMKTSIVRRTLRQI